MSKILDAEGKEIGNQLYRVILRCEEESMITRYRMLVGATCPSRAIHASLRSVLPEDSGKEFSSEAVVDELDKNDDVQATLTNVPDGTVLDGGRMRFGK